MFGFMKKRTSSPEDFSGVEAVIESCAHFADAAEVIGGKGYCTEGYHGDILDRSASRIAVLRMLADKGVVVVSSGSRLSVPELAGAVREFVR